MTRPDKIQIAYGEKFNGIFNNFLINRNACDELLYIDGI